MEAERQSKKIVKLNTFVAPKKGKSLAQTRRGYSASQPTPPPPNRAQSAIAKARNDAARARVALTHASGKYIPPPVAAPRKPTTARGEGDLFKNPYLASNGASSSSTSAPPKPVAGPRLPAPRIPRPKGVFPDAYNTKDEAARRAALPVSIIARPPSPPRERFRIDDTPRTSVPIPKPKVDNFKPSKPLPFFSGPPVMGVKRPGEGAASPHGDKRARLGDGSSAPSSEAGSRPPSRPTTPKPATNLNNVLFMKKPKPKAPVSRAAPVKR